VKARRAVWPLLATLVVGAILVVGVFPTRAYLAQQASIAKTQHQLSVLDGQNRSLQARVATLNTDAEIERLAREEYNLVRPGEESFAILPSPPPQITVPDAWPFTGLQQRLAGASTSTTAPPG
jgi:cell division protein FtsB